MKNKNSPPSHQEDPCFMKEAKRASIGISFDLPSRRRFIPYSWLQYVELDRDGTELRFQYTDSLVMVSGSGLQELQKAAETFELREVRELPVPTSTPAEQAVVDRIEIYEHAPS